LSKSSRNFVEVLLQPVEDTSRQCRSKVLSGERQHPLSRAVTGPAVQDVVVILNFARDRHLLIFPFLSRWKSRQVETCFAPYPFTCHRLRFSERRFLLFLISPYPLIVRPMEFRLVFASLALVALEAGHSRRSYFS
jgi:hypothetical protein